MAHPVAVLDQAPPNGDNNNNNDEPQVGGFSIGDRIVVEKNRTHRGKEGVVSRFCANGSRVFLFLRLDESPDVPRRFKVDGLRRIPPRPPAEDAPLPVLDAEVVRAEPVEPVPEYAPSAEVVIAPMEEEASTVSGTTSRRSIGESVRSYARKLVDVDSFVESLRERLPMDENRDLNLALREIQNMLRGVLVRNRTQ
jgi:hypothetical protein